MSTKSYLKPKNTWFTEDKHLVPTPTEPEDIATYKEAVEKIIEINIVSADWTPIMNTVCASWEAGEIDGEIRCYEIYTAIPNEH